MNLLSLSKFADSHGVSRQAAYKWKARGLLVFKESKVDVDASNAKLKLYLRDGVPIVDSVDTSPQTDNLADTLLTDDGETIPDAAVRALAESGAFLSTEEAKRLKENYLARLAQLEYDTKSGRVVEAAQVAARVGAEYAEVRTKLLAIPAEQAPRINRCRNAAEVQDTLREIITRVLEALSGDEI